MTATTFSNQAEVLTFSFVGDAIKGYRRSRARAARRKQLLSLDDHAAARHGAYPPRCAARQLLKPKPKPKKQDLHNHDCHDPYCPYHHFRSLVPSGCP